MINNHPIIPSTKLLDQWCMDPELDGWRLIATQAAQWGADQELEACCEWLHDTCVEDPEDTVPELRAARRPKPPTLKEQALGILDVAHHDVLEDDQIATIRRALKALPND